MRNAMRQWWSALAVTTGLVLFGSQSFGQVVQLPTVQVFSYSGSVAVPDQGTSYLGGNASSASFQRPYGRPRSTSLSRLNTAGNSSVHARVIDLDELDRQVLGQPSNRTVPSNIHTVRRNSIPTSPGSVAGIYSSPLPDEKVVQPPTTRRSLKDISPGDYMLLLSHPEIVNTATRNDPHRIRP